MTDLIQTGSKPGYFLLQDNLLSLPTTTSSLDPSADFGLETITSASIAPYSSSDMHNMSSLPISKPLVFDVQSSAGYVDICYKLGASTVFNLDDDIFLGAFASNAGTLQIAWHGGTPTGAPGNQALSAGPLGTDNTWEPWNSTFSGNTLWTNDMSTLERFQGQCFFTENQPSPLTYVWIRLGSPRGAQNSLWIGMLALGVMQWFDAPFEVTPPEFGTPSVRKGMRPQLPEDDIMTYNNTQLQSSYGETWSYRRGLQKTFSAGFDGCNYSTMERFSELFHHLQGGHLPFLFVRDGAAFHPKRQQASIVRLSNELTVSRRAYDSHNDESLYDIAFDVTEEPIGRIITP